MQQNQNIISVEEAFWINNLSIFNENINFNFHFS